MSLRVENLHKSFGSKKVLKGLNFEAKPGQAFALLGRNGAGKTTTIRIIMNVFKADQGKLLWQGQDLRQSQLRIAYLPEERGLYEKEPILRQMIFIGELRNLSYKEAKRAAETWLDRFGMLEHKNDKLETLSKGNQQKIQLAVALMNEPQLIIFDEPFTGLDPVNAQILKEVILEQIAAQKVVFFSSHQMSYVEDICKDLALLYNGVISIQGSIKEIRRSFKRNKIALDLRVGEHFLEAGEAVEYLQKAIAGGQIHVPVTKLKAGKESAILTLAEAKDRDQLWQDLTSLDLCVDKYAVVEPDLKEIFIHYTGGEALNLSEAEVREKEA